MRLAAFEPNNSSVIDGIAWEESPCLLCGSALWKPRLEAADPLQAWRFQIVQCLHCDLCFTNPRPHRHCINQFYPADYHCFQSKQRPSRPDSMSKLLPIRGQARLLDFGCGAGGFLRAMHAMGWNATGLDTAAEIFPRLHTSPSDLSEEAALIPIRIGTLPQVGWPDGCFEAITMRQSLEHVHQPLEVLRDAYRLLTPGGRLIVTVPNFDSLASRWFGSHWYGLDLPRHLSHFTAATLGAMLHRAGFPRIELRQERRASWIRHSGRLAEQHGLQVGWLQTRFGSGLAGWLGRLLGQADCLLAIADRS